MITPENSTPSASSPLLTADANNAVENHALMAAVCFVSSVGQLPFKIAIDALSLPWIIFCGVSDRECFPCAQHECGTYEKLSSGQQVDRCSKFFAPMASTVHHAEQACASAPTPTIMQ